MTSFDLTETDRLLTTTRAVRKRLDLTRAVPESDCAYQLFQRTTLSKGLRFAGWKSSPRV